MGCRQLEAHGLGHKSQAVLMPETQPLWCKFLPVRGEGDGPRSARAEPWGEGEGSGTLGGEATPTSASRG